MSKIWISAAAVLIVVGTASSVVLMEEAQQVPAEPHTASTPAPNKPAGSIPPATTPELTRAQPKLAPAGELRLWDEQSLVASESNGIPVYQTQVAPDLLQSIDGIEHVEETDPRRRVLSRRG